MEDETVNATPIIEFKKAYRIVRKLGSGGFGVVYLLRHRKFEEYCAAKYQPWHESNAKSPWQKRNIQTRVSQEVKILKKLSNVERKHVVHFLGYFVIPHPIIC